MGTLIVSDLDRTLIYSPSALQLSGSDHRAPPLVSVEVLEGRPHSFITLSAAQTLHQVAQSSEFVPTTTRTMSQYRRVRFPGITPRFAITSNGGNIMVNGNADVDWYADTVAAIAESDASLAEVEAELKARSDYSWAVKQRSGDGLFCYLVVDTDVLPTDFLPAWTEWCNQRGWRVSMQSRKIYAIPGALSKERAVAEVASRVGSDRVLAAGDGALDAGFLAAADAGIRPPHGELASIGWNCDTVEVANHMGVAAADDITNWFAEKL